MNHPSYLCLASKIKTSIIWIVVILLQTYTLFSPLPTRAEENSLHPLDDHINTISWEVKRQYDTNFEPLDSQQPIEIKPENTYRLTINYELPAQTLNTSKTHCIYTLPSQFRINTQRTGPIKSGNTEVGTYTIDINGNITLTYNDNLITENETKNIYGSINFELNGSEIQLSQETETVPFTDTIQHQLTKPTTDPEPGTGSIYIQKNGEKIDETTAQYTIKVQSQGNTSQPITILDTLKEGKATYDQTSFTIKKDNETIEATPTFENNTFQLQLPALEANQTYTITYNIISDTLKNNETNQIQNLVEAQNGNQTINVYGPVITFTRNILEKTGKRNNDGTITWTIQLNQDKENLKGYTLKDQFNQEEKTIQAKIEPALDGQDTITLPHTFEQNNTDTYTITYTTDPEVLINNQQTLNKAIQEKGEETIEQETGVYIEEAHTYKPLKKQGNKITLTKDNNYETEWTLTIDLDQGSLAKNWTITDQLEGGSNTHYTTQQKEALIKEIQTKFDTTNNQPTTNGFTSEQLTFEWTNIDERGQTRSFQITGKQPLPKGTNINIKYTNLTQVENEATLSNKAKLTDRQKEQYDQDNLTIPNL